MIVASVARSTGSVSPAGEALATLPPIVPRFWICAAPIVAAASTSAGTCSRHSADRRMSVYVVSAPSRSSPRSSPMPRSSSSLERSIIRSGGGPISPVIWTMTSVPPAIGRWAPVARIANASLNVRGVSIGGSTGIGSGPWPGDVRDRVDDLRVARAAAEVAGDRLADRVLVGGAAGVDVDAGGHQHPRRADPPLRGACVEERLLELVERRGLGRLWLPRGRGARRWDARIGAARRKALDRSDEPSVDLADRHETGIDDLAVKHDRARAALPFPAALLRPGQAEILAEDVEQPPHAGDVDLDRLRVDEEA